MAPESDAGERRTGVRFDACARSASSATTPTWRSRSFCTVALQIEVWFASYATHRPAALAARPPGDACRSRSAARYPLAAYLVDVARRRSAIVKLASGVRRPVRDLRRRLRVRAVLLRRERARPSGLGGGRVDPARDHRVRDRRRRSVSLGRHRLRGADHRRPVARRADDPAPPAERSGRSRSAPSSSSATRTSGPAPPWPRSGPGSRASSTTSSRTRSRSSSSRPAAGARCSTSDPEASRTAFDSIERTGEQALGEMRRLLGMLRDDDEERSRAPQPSLERLEALADEMRASGLPVELDGRGRPERDPTGDRRLRLPDRAGGADERAQARRAGGRARRRALRRRRGRDRRRRRRPRRPQRRRARATACSGSGSASPSSAARSRPARVPTAASPSTPACRTGTDA